MTSTSNPAPAIAKPWFTSPACSVAWPLAPPHRRWFRYHSLLRDLLRFELQASDHARQRDRLQRAAMWHIEQNDLEVAADYLVVAELWEDLVDVPSARTAAAFSSAEPSAQ